MRDDDDVLPNALSEAVELLRAAPPARAEWRAEILRQAREQAAEQAPAKPVGGAPHRAGDARAARSKISLSVPWAIAAGVACALAGAGASMVLRPASQRGAPAAAATAQSSAVIPPRAETIAAEQAGLPVRFSLAAPGAARVSIVGDFNHWNPTALPMRRSADGRVWEVEVRLPLGRYNYAFLVDGRLARDPLAPSTMDEDFGTPNSVLMVRGS